MAMTADEKSMRITELVKKNFNQDLLQYTSLNVRHSQMRENAVEVEVYLRSAKYGTVGNFRFVVGRIVNFLHDLYFAFGPDNYREDDVLISEEAPEGINKGGKTTCIYFQIG
jgi:hypothetical protein